MLTISSISIGFFFSFLWKGPDKIARKTVVGSVKDGGLGMPDIYAIYKAQRINWLRRFFDEEVSHPWKNFLTEKLKSVGGINILLKCNFDIKYLPLSLSDFELSMLKTWRELTFDSYSNRHFLNQCIWNNNRIVIGGKSVFYKEFNDVGIFKDATYERRLF